MPSLADAARRLKRVGPPPAFGRDLPACILVVDSARLADPQAAIRALPPGSAVILRDYAAADRSARAVRLAALCQRRRLRLLIAGDARLALSAGASGIHLPEAMVRAGDRRWRRWRKPGWMVSAAAHSPAAIALARRAGAEAILLSPVFATASHPNAATLGPLRFAAWTRRAGLPVYALGGLTAATARRLVGSGAAGAAAVAGFADRCRCFT